MSHTCSDTEREAIRLLDGEMSEGEREQLEGHLRGCERCRAEVEELEALRRQWSTFPLQPSLPEDRTRIRGLAAAELTPRRPGRGWIDWVTGAAFGLSLVLVILLYRGRQGDEVRASYEVLTPQEWTARANAVPIIEESRPIDMGFDSRVIPSGK